MPESSLAVMGLCAATGASHEHSGLGALQGLRALPPVHPSLQALLYPASSVA